MTSKILRLAEIGHRIRQARTALGMTQFALAQRVGLARGTINQLERGTVADIGVSKLLKVLSEVGLAMQVDELPKKKSDALKIASTAASTGFRTALHEPELLQILLSGDVPKSKRPHMRRLLEDSPPSLIHRVVDEMAGMAQPGRIQRNLESIATSLGMPEQSVAKWLKRD